MNRMKPSACRWPPSFETTDATTRSMNDLLSLHGTVAPGVRNSLLRLLTPLGMVQPYRNSSRTLSMLNIDWDPIVDQITPTA